jgi:ribosome assembly protein 3
MQKIALEFAEDLDQIRNSEDFNDGALPMLVSASEQGTSIFTKDEQRRLTGNKSG